MLLEPKKIYKNTHHQIPGSATGSYVSAGGVCSICVQPLRPGLEEVVGLALSIRRARLTPTPGPPVSSWCTAMRLAVAVRFDQPDVRARAFSLF